MGFRKIDKMKRVFFTIVLIFFTISVFAQKTKEVNKLQDTLMSHRSGEKHWGVKNHLAYKLLSIDKYNNTAIFYLMGSFREMKQKDSISHFFDNLIEQNKNEVEPYLIREQYNNYDNPSYTFRIRNLKKALAVDSLEPRVNYLLGKLYYELFTKEYKKSSKNANTDRYAQNTYQYFMFLYNLNDGYKEMLKYPLIQLSNYLGKTNDRKKIENTNIQTSYFPISAFLHLPNDWKTNYEVDVIAFASGTDFNFKGVESAIFRLNWYSKHLEALLEPVLDISLPTQIFRFTYLRTFHNPIVIGLVNSNDTILIYWKVSDGAGGYEPGKIIEDKSKKLTLKDWEDFTKKIISMKFWNIPTIKTGLIGTDGSQWILEWKGLGAYHVVDRWGGGEIYSVCKNLIELTDLKLEKIY